ncbi:GNAT family N-acetyltransferase [Kitasatospora sp. CB01950]|uniref:GNAT family N-acetyltransferase n=1 Tax=Kitasatospora sp. CB01950 TaxID=1703930 RepID=UPI00093E2DFA|nr:GNAT family N-acetyltransferase [Kitasatospora sp. CB01950]OKJ05628.1 GCN5 family acetyltransferase [Kitasatospora sp. CB01950]
MNTVMINRVDEAQWQAVADEQIVGHGDVSQRPDGRLFVSIDVWQDEAFDPLADAMLGELPGAVLHTLVGGEDAELASRWQRAGFTVERREWEYLMPTRTEPAADRAEQAGENVTILPAGTADEQLLRALDRDVRAQVEAAVGWHTMPAELRPHAAEDTLIDPSLYAVAVLDGQYAGLIRVVSRGRRARIGLLAVRAELRRRGAGRALLRHALATLREAGIDTAWTEIDQSHTAATTLFEEFGARRTGHLVELVRRPH